MYILKEILITYHLQFSKNLRLKITQEERTSKTSDGIRKIKQTKQASCLLFHFFNSNRCYLLKIFNLINNKHAFQSSANLGRNLLNTSGVNVSGPEKLDCNIILRSLIIIIIKIYCYGCCYHYVSFLPNEEKRERERKEDVYSYNSQSTNFQNETCQKYYDLIISNMKLKLSVEANKAFKVLSTENS